MSNVSNNQLLSIAIITALLISNSPLASIYFKLIHFPCVSINILNTHYNITTQWIINDLLMVSFFALVTLDIKKEYMVGIFKNKKYAIWPIAAALGGVVVPGLLYGLCQTVRAGDMRGWAIPMATDITMSLSAVALLGSQVPTAFRALLAALAIVDDLCAILIVAGYYTQKIQGVWFFISGLIIILLYELNRRKINQLYPYLILWVCLWFALLCAGIHSTIAGVVLAMILPFQLKDSSGIEGPAQRLEYYLRPVVEFIVLPLFIFVNIGVPLIGTAWQLNHPVFLGILVGLVLGKPLGILLGSAMVLWLNVGALPQEIHWRHLFSLACLGGIGFTMSLFIGVLSFFEDSILVLVRQAILLGSLISVLMAYLVFPKTSTRCISHVR